jgi:hypothetical protein
VFVLEIKHLTMVTLLLLATLVGLAGLAAQAKLVRLPKFQLYLEKVKLVFAQWLNAKFQELFLR